MLAFLRIGHSAHIAPVVIAEQDEHIVGHLHPLVVVVEHFFVKSPHLRCLSGGPFGHVGNDFPLVGHDTLQQFGVGILAHGLVAVASHGDSHHVVGSFHSLDAFTEETVEVLLVGVIVPGAPFLSFPGVFLMVACHGLVVGCSHDDTHLIGCLRVLGVVGIECPAPHGRPHEVALQSKDEFKYLFVEPVVAIVGAECVFHPRGQTGGFVVEEDTAVAHCRLAIGVGSFLDKYRLVVLDGHVGPVVPGRNSQLARQLIDAVDGSSPVAAGNDELLVGGRDDVHFVFALQRFCVEESFFRHFIDNLAASKGSCHDGGR